MLHRYGGAPGLRHRNLLESAPAQPKVTVAGKFAHKTLFSNASAYGFHISENHPFVDGNKRVTIVLMDIFLQMNGWEIVAREEEAYTTMMALASGRLTKALLASWLKEHSRRLSHR